MAHTLLILLIISLLIAIIFLHPVVVRWQRRRIAQRPFPPRWRAIVEQRVVPYNHLLPEQRSAFYQQLQVCLAEKQFIGCNGLQVTEEMRVTVAAMASLLLLHNQGNYFPKLKTVLLYPSAYWVTENTPMDRYVRQERRVSRLGESWLRDQLVLAWDQVDHDTRHWQDGHNVVLHEFAHQLDQAEGEANGVPILPPSIDPATWSRVMTATYEDLCQTVNRNRRSVLKSYGATNPAEFFSVATETFFERPRRLRSRYPELYDLLQQYYQINPISWDAG